MSKDILDCEFPLQVFWQELRKRYTEHNTAYELVLTETHRSVERQQELYKQGRTQSGPIVTKVDGVKVKGKHNYVPSKAFDVAVKNKATGKIVWDEALYDILGHMTEEINKQLWTKVKWGGNFKSFRDRPHFEL